MPSGLGLVRYDAMCLAIAESHRVDEVKDIRDKMIAIEAYAKQARNLDAENKAAEIRIRAERRTGELLREMKEAGQRQTKGDNGRNSRAMSRATTLPPTPPPSLKDLGITRDQSSKWQQLANVPQKEFERAVNGDGGPKPTTEGIINAAKLKREIPLRAWTIRRSGFGEGFETSSATAFSKGRLANLFPA